jgi:hypothetical protein
MLKCILSMQISPAVVLGREEGRFPLINEPVVPRTLQRCYGRRFTPVPKQPPLCVVQQPAAGRRSTSPRTLF